MRRFNTAGPVRPAEHYCVPPLERLHLGELLALVRGKQYFVLYAPRQTGKTSALFALRDLLNSGTEGAYRCAYVNVETAQTAREDVGRAMGAILDEMAAEALDTLGDSGTARTGGVNGHHDPAGHGAPEVSRPLGRGPAGARSSD